MQFGAAQDSAGNKTAPETLQRVIWGQYTNSWHSPVLTGGAVSGTASLNYAVTAGSSVVRVADGRAVYAVWDDTQLATTAPDSGTVDDVIYVDPDGAVGVARRGAVPYSAYTTLDIRRISAGATATTSTVSIWNKNYAITYGAAAGNIAEYSDPATTGSTASDTWTQTLAFRVPRDMLIEVELIASFATDPGGSSELAPASIFWYLSLDSNTPLVYEMPIDRRYSTQQYLFRESVSAGEHTFTVRRQKGWWGPNVRRVIHVGTGPGDRHIPTMYRIREYAQAM